MSNSEFIEVNKMIAYANSLFIKNNESNLSDSEKLNNDFSEYLSKTILGNKNLNNTSNKELLNNNSSDDDSSDDDSFDDCSSDDDSSDDDSSIDDNLLNKEEEFYSMCGTLIHKKEFLSLLKFDGMSEEQIYVLIEKLLFPLNNTNYDVDLPNPDLNYENQNYSSVLISYLLQKNLAYIDKQDIVLLINYLKKSKKNNTKTNVEIVDDIFFETENHDISFESLYCEEDEEEEEDEKEIKVKIKKVKVIEIIKEKPVEMKKEKPVEIKKHENKKKITTELTTVYPYFICDDGHKIDVLKMVFGCNKIDNTVNIDDVYYTVVYPETEKYSKLWFKHLGELTKYHNKKNSDKSILDYFSKIGKEAKKIKF